MNRKGFALSHPTGNTFVRALLNHLYKSNQLEFFFTTIGFGIDYHLLPESLSKKRSYNIPDKKIKRLWFPEIMRLMRDGNQENRRRAADFSYSCLDQEVSENLIKSKAEVLHAYEDGALKSFSKAKDLGIKCSYELPIAHWATVRRLLSNEAERYPEWEPTLESTREPEEKLIKKENELILADRIVCPSNFVLESIPQKIRSRIPCIVTPFGSPDVFGTVEKTERKSFAPLKLLFVGSMTQRKGLADVFEAMKILKREPIELSILGRPSLPMQFYRKQLSNFHYFPPCSHSEVIRIMQSHDALVLPSIIEGRALVQQEALANGLPIIVTKNAGGEDLVHEKTTGFLVPICSPEKIAEKIVYLLENRNSLDELKRCCQLMASKYKWANYAQQIFDFKRE